MILGQSRVPFSRPSGASPSFQPQLPNTGFYSHFHPLTMVTHAMTSSPAYRPPYQNSMGPTPMPDVPAPQPAAPIAATVPKAGGTAGFAGVGFGSTGGVRAHSHVDPYMVMRQGVIPGVAPSGSNIRAGVRNAGQRVHYSIPFQHAPLPPLPPPPAPMPAMPAPAATHGLFGALGRIRGRRPGWFARNLSFNPPPVQDSESCEKIGPRRDGLFVTICNGRVTQYSDAQGNVHQNPYANY